MENTDSLTLENQRTRLTRVSVENSNEIVNTKRRWSATVDRGKTQWTTNLASEASRRFSF